VMMMRLKNAQREKERKALEEELIREDEAADAAEALGYLLNLNTIVEELGLIFFKNAETKSAPVKREGERTA
jgi:hypothetical protein